MTNETPSHQELLDQLQVKLLQEVPGGDDFNTHTTWLGSIPNYERITRNDKNNSNDLVRILMDLDKLGKLKSKDKWAVEVFAEKAIEGFDQFDIYSEVKALLEQYVRSKQRQAGSHTVSKDLKESAQQKQNDEDLKKLYNSLNAITFDLINLVRSCMEEIEDRQGLIGFFVCYDDPIFLKNFSERIKDKLGKKITVIGDFQDLDTYRKVEVNINTIKRYKNLLETKHVVCPVKGSKDSTVTIASKKSLAFWQGISNEFKNGFAHRLVIIMGGITCDIFPEGLIPLELSQPKKVDVLDWIRPIASYFDWGELFIREWGNEMLNQCHYEGENELRIELIYRYIDIVSEELRPLLPKPDSAKFLDSLKSRRVRL